MKRTNGSLARYARPLFVTATLVSSIALAFTPSVPSAIALTASPEPSAAAAPTTSPAPDPTPDPTADPTPAPTADVAPTPAPEAPVSNPAPGPVATPAPGVSPAQTDRTPRAISFDATRGQHARVPDAAAFRLPVFTVETWFRRAAPRPGEPAGMSGVATTTMTPGRGSGAPTPSASEPGSLGLASVIPLVTLGDGQDAAGRIGWFVGFDARSAVLVADFQDDADGSHHPVVGTTALADGTWYHVAATYDGRAWRLYLNGRLEAERRLGDVTPDTTGSAPVGLGAAVSGDGTAIRGAFDGDLDETRIWAIARTGAEIRADLSRPVAADADDLVAAWSMDEAGGDVLSDATAAHRDASLIADPARIDSPIPDDTIPARPGVLTAQGGAAGVALDWKAVRASDLAGYNVYRTDSGRLGADAEPLNGPIPITATAYLDSTVASGTSYRYVVTAVDRFGNESAASEVAAATVDAPPAATAEPSATAGPSPAAEPAATAEPTPAPSPAAARVVMSLTSAAAGEGRHRVEPGSTVAVTVGLTAPAGSSRADLALSIPEGWTVLDADGGVVDTIRHRIGWLLAGTPAGSEVAHLVSFVAPTVLPLDGGRSLASTFAAWLESPDATTAGPTLDILVAPRLVVEQAVLAQVDPATLEATYLPGGAPITDEQRFETFRLRFQVRNADDLPVAVAPQLEYRAVGAGEFRPVPALDDQAGFPFFVGREWRPIPGGAGTELGPVRAEIPAGSMLIEARDGADQVAVTGTHSMGVNPLATVDLPGRSFTEVEFSVRATAAADYLAGYEFRITDGGQPIANAPLALVTLGPKPAIAPDTVLRNGIPAGGPEPQDDAATGAIGYPLEPSAAASSAGTAPRYSLVVARASPTTDATAGSEQTASDSPHGGYSATTDACASCHSSHSAAGPALLVRASPQSTLCLTCHRAGGSAADTDVEAQYADPTVPQNDPATRTYYSHDALAPNSGHTSAGDDEFGGVTDRHSECADCHSPHAATSTASVQTPAGWTASGRLGEVSGVSVTNSPNAGGTPTYTLIGGASAPITFEYQLCFKCHSGYTELPSNTGFTPSRYLLDKAVELNPKNPSFHPIEAAGTNATAAMTASLEGPSTYKLWNFTTTSTIRCENCHGNDRTVARALAEKTALPPGADLAPHANQPEKDPAAAAVPGILSGSYKYRELKTGSDIYRAADFALCYTCHSEEPFLDTSGSPRADTNFQAHGQHVSGIANRGPAGTDIDKAGDGGGLATCAECHFRIHSTTYRVGGQDAYPRLVNFAPNVTANGSATDPVGADAWDPTAKTCTLTCHGQGHGAKGY